MQERGKWRIPSDDITVERGESRECKRGPGGDDPGGEDRSSLDDISSSLTLGEFCKLDCTFSLLFLFQLIPLPFEVVEMASARLTE
jgi:hypothetical protein